MGKIEARIYNIWLWWLIVGGGCVAGVARLKAPTGRTDCGKTWGAACVEQRISVVLLQLGLGSKESGRWFISQESQEVKNIVIV